MPRERILSAEDANRAERVAVAAPKSPVKTRDDEPALRPRHINEMVGQRDVAEQLRIAVDAARKRGEPLGHVLFDGPPGLGKTTFATCIPRE